MSIESTLRTAMLVRLTEVTNRTFVLPLVVFYPTSRCNSRCVSCDWWKASGDGGCQVQRSRIGTNEEPRGA